MALDSAIYLVTREIAMRSGVINSRYRTADGRFILSNKDLALVRLTSDEYVTGLKGIEVISVEESQRLIAENHFQRGLGNMSYAQSNVEEQPEVHEEQQVGDEEPADNDGQQEAEGESEEVEDEEAETEENGDGGENENNEEQEQNNEEE